MGTRIPTLMGTQATRVPGEPGLGPFGLVRRSAGQGHGQNPPVTLPRFATLESARSIQRPSMGLLRRPTPGEIVEGGRLCRPCGPGTHSRAISENQFAASPPIPHFSKPYLSLTRTVAFSGPRSVRPEIVGIAEPDAQCQTPVAQEVQRDRLPCDLVDAPPRERK